MAASVAFSSSSPFTAPASGPAAPATPATATAPGASADPVDPASSAPSQTRPDKAASSSATPPSSPTQVRSPSGAALLDVPLAATPAASPDGGLPAASGSGAHTLGPGDAPTATAGASAGGSHSQELPEDDGMRSLRQRIHAVQARDVPSSEKARLMHDLLMEGYERSRQAQALRSPSSARTGTSPRPVPASPQAPPSPAPSASPASGPHDVLSRFESLRLESLNFESLKFWHHHAAEPHLAAAASTFQLTEEDLQPTYVPEELVRGAAAAASCKECDDGDDDNDGETGDDNGQPPLVLGCEHYRRKVKLQCFTCERWYTCRLCHNEAEDHVLPRRATRHMLCMLCGHAQRASDVCANPQCGASVARYYCGICKLWDDDPDKAVYHCADCGICRVGEGLGKDFFHCKKCGTCIAIHQEESHRCREGVMDCDCPICGEYMFTTHKKVVTMKCGHTIHGVCRAEYMKRSYKCPICSKTVENMESMFRRLDKHLEEQPMPPEYSATRAVVLCNDCAAKTVTRYHWGGLRCEVCLSYNTVELRLLNSPALAATGDADTSHSAAAASAAAAAANVAAAGASTSSAAAAALLLRPPPPSPLHLAPPAAAVPASTVPPLLPPPPSSSSPLQQRFSLQSVSSLSSSPRSPVLLFRSASPAVADNVDGAGVGTGGSSTAAAMDAFVAATAPPGYSEDGFSLEGDEDDYRRAPDMEDADILGLFGGRTLSWTPWRHSDDDNAADDDDDAEDDDSDEDDEDSEDDDDDDDDDEEEAISLFGHR